MTCIGFGFTVNPNNGTSTITLEVGKTYFFAVGHVMGGILTFTNADVLKTLPNTENTNISYIIKPTSTSVVCKNTYTGTTYVGIWNIWKLD